LNLVGEMQNTEQKTNQRMPGRSSAVVGSDVTHGPVGAKPTEKPPATGPVPPAKKPVIKDMPRKPAKH
jgi:hypothetical protein